MLDSFLNENGKSLIKIFIISLQKNEGNVVCLCPSKIYLPRLVPKPGGKKCHIGPYMSCVGILAKNKENKCF